MKSLCIIATSTAAAFASGFLIDRKKLLARYQFSAPGSEIKQWDYNWDGRDYRREENEAEDKYGSDKPEKPTATRHLILIRHGQYVFDKDPSKKILTELGRQQADLTGQRLKQLDFPRLSRLVFSTMPRAQETGCIISKHLPEIDIEHCDFLREGAPIRAEPPTSNWRPDAHQYITDGARIEAAFRRYFHRADPSQTETSYEVYVCHANVIRYLTCRALQLPPEAWLRMSLHNGSITWLTIRPNGKVGVKMIGDCGFMPKDYLTFN